MADPITITEKQYQKFLNQRRLYNEFRLLGKGTKKRTQAELLSTTPDTAPGYGAKSHTDLVRSKDVKPATAWVNPITGLAKGSVDNWHVGAFHHIGPIDRILPFFKTIPEEGGRADLERLFNSLRDSGVATGNEITNVVELPWWLHKSKNPLSIHALDDAQGFDSKGRYLKDGATVEDAISAVPKLARDVQSSKRSAQALQFSTTQIGDPTKDFLQSPGRGIFTPSQQDLLIDQKFLQGGPSANDLSDWFSNRVKQTATKQLSEDFHQANEKQRIRAKKVREAVGPKSPYGTPPPNTPIHITKQASAIKRHTGTALRYALGPASTLITKGMAEEAENIFIKDPSLFNDILRKIRAGEALTDVAGLTATIWAPLTGGKSLAVAGVAEASSMGLGLLGDAMETGYDTYRSFKDLYSAVQEGIKKQDLDWLNSIDKFR